MDSDRRRFLKQSIASATGLAAAAFLPGDVFSRGLHGTNRPEEIIIQPEKRQAPKESIRFSVIGLNHFHIYGMLDFLIRGGGTLVSVYSREPELLPGFTQRYPNAKVAKSEEEILGDTTIQLVASASIPVERAPLGIRVMKSGKDYFVDKPGILTLKQLAAVKKVQNQTKQIYSIFYNERLGSPTGIKESELVQSGTIGKVVQLVGLGPHSLNLSPRPDWFWDPEKAGGILCDIGSHQCEQFLHYTNSKQAEVSNSQIGNFHTPEYPKFMDFGDMNVRSPHATGYIRTDWLTPKGLPVWGDGRTFILGTEGYIETRKYIDIAGRKGGNHLLLVDQKGIKYFDCSNVYAPYGENLISDVVNRTETVMTQAHCFLAAELAIKAQKTAYQLNV